MDHRLLTCFDYSDLPDHLARIAKPFYILAHQLVGALPENSARTDALRRLLESKESAVRSVITSS